MIHLLDTEEPISTIRNKDQKANCGKIVLNAEPLYSNDWAEGECQEWLDNANICWKCRRIAQKRNPSRFTYGLMPGQELINGRTLH